MAETDKIYADDYSAPNFKEVSEDMTKRMRGIRQRFEWCVEAEKDLREDGLDDFRFAWIAGNQWDGNLAAKRGLRPQYEFNKLGQAIKQVINSNRQNTPSIKVRANKESTRDLAEIRQGLMRNIESLSNADTVYDWGALYAITSGFGCWEVVAEYADDESFDQDLFVRRIENPLVSVWFDGSAKELDKRDGRYAFKKFNKPWPEFRRDYPNAEYSDFDSVVMGADKTGEWFGEKSCQICEYWYKETVDEEIYQLSDGRVVKASEWDPVSKDASNALSAVPEQPQQGVSDPSTPPGMPPQAPPPPTGPSLMGMPMPPQAPVTIVKKRTVKVEKVKKEIVSGLEVLDGPFDWPGKFIPLVPVYGNIVNDEGETNWFGMVRWSKDAQRLYNYNRSNMVEVMANQNRAPFLYTPRQVEGFETQWKNMAVDNAPGLPYNPDPATGGGAPQRQPPPAFPNAMLEAANVDDQDIKATTGVWQASLGQPSNETSGKAIQARARNSDNATFEYSDNIAKAVQYTGEIINDLIPSYYDTYRELRILGADGAERYVEVNKPVYNPDTQQWEKVNDLSQGMYDITCTVGPSYATQRMETLDAMLQMAQSGGPSALLFQYGAMKNMDVPGMQEVEEALRNMLVGMHLLQPDDNQPPAPPPAPPPPNPKDMAAAQAAQAKAQLDTAKAQKTQVETHMMVEEAPARLASVQANAQGDGASAAITASDAAWKEAHLQAKDQMLRNSGLIALDQQTLPNGGM